VADPITTASNLRETQITTPAEPELPHPRVIFDTWQDGDIARLDAMVARRQALMRREFEQEMTR